MGTPADGTRRRKTNPALTTDAGKEPGGRVTARRELVENEIYEQASRLFAERGFAGTSFQDIADAVGLTRPALYYYVNSKEGLLEKLVSDITQVSAADMRAVAVRQDLDAARKLHTIVRMGAARQAAHPARFQLLVRSEADLPPQVGKAHAAAQRAVLKAMASVIDEGIATGLFRPVDARVAALGVLGMMNWVSWWFQPGGRDNAGAMAEQLAEMAVNALKSRNDRTPDGPGAVVELLRENLAHLERLLDR